MSRNDHLARLLASSFLLAFLAQGVLALPFAAQYQADGTPWTAQVVPSQAGGSVVVVGVERRPSFVWYSGELVLLVVSSANSTIWCRVLAVEKYAFRDEVVQRQLEAGVNRVVVPLVALPNALPGNYSYLVLVSEQSSPFLADLYEGEFSVVLGGGLPTLVAAILTFAVAGTVTLARGKKSAPVEPVPVVLPASSPVSPTPLTGAPPGRIKCPTCKKDVEEGSQFCPECGARIPEYLQRNPAA
ncbi:MAG: hypothetical protein Kow0069_04590 [Promethearchaeota archaeon]